MATEVEEVAAEMRARNMVPGLTERQQKRVDALAEYVERDLDAGPVTVLDGTVLAHDVAVIVYTQNGGTRCYVDIGDQDELAPSEPRNRAANMIVKVRPRA